MTSSRESSKTGLRTKAHFIIMFDPFCVVFSFFFFNLPLLLISRLQFEARNQKKEAKEIAVIEAMKRREQQEQPGDASQAAH